MRSGRTDFGIAERPLSMCQRSTTCAGGLAVPLRDAGDDRIGERVPAASASDGRVDVHTAERRPRLRRDAARGVDRAQRRLVVVGVDLDLVDGRHDREPRQHGLEVRRAEVGHADGPHAPLVEQPLERPIGVDGRVEVLGQWLVEQVQVHVSRPELAGAHVEGMEGRVVAVVADPHLRLDEQLGPVDAARGDRGADLALVEVRRRRCRSSGSRHAAPPPRLQMPGTGKIS